MIDPPRIISITISEDSVAVGNNVIINCLFDANPSPTIVRWYHNSTILNDNGVTSPTSSELRLVSLRGLQDSGTYKCTINNTLGSASDTVSLTVQSMFNMQNVWF